MDEIKAKLSNIFTMARVHLTTTNPDDEDQLIRMIEFKREVLNLLDKIPQEKKK